MTPTFSLLLTTARPAGAAAILGEWRARSGLRDADFDAEVEVVVTVDKGREAELTGFREAFPSAILGINEGQKDCVTGWNMAAAMCTGKVMINLSDDFMPCQDWFQALLDLKPARWPDLECVVAVSDGCNSDLFCIGIQTRKRYDRFGYFFYGSYQSLFSDTEMTALAIADEVVIDARHLLFEHRHYSGGKRFKDAVDIEHASDTRWKCGEALFNMRREAGFPLDMGPLADRRMAGPLKMAGVVQAIRDDFCLYDVCDRLLSERRGPNHVLEAIYLFVPDKFWSGQPNTAANMEEITQVCGRLRGKHGADSIRSVYFSVDKVSRFDQPRIRVETDCRNWYLAQLAHAGYEHGLVLDSDELWAPGLLGKLAEYVRWNGPNSVYTGMIPVAGLPGYPIEGALDKATIYTHTGCRIKECRGAFGIRHELPGHEIYHFSATRRTIEEIAQKHLDSGHNLDPDYDFQGWIDNVLLKGKLVPGARNVHMYTKGRNVWPLIRNWLPGELAQIPQSIHQYLGKA